METARRARSLGRLFGTHAAISLIPVLVLGVVLAASLRGEARKRGLGTGRSEAALVAQTAVEPLLDGRLLSSGLTLGEQAALRRLVARAARSRDLLRLRLRDLNGQIRFSDDGSGFGVKPEGEALSAATGNVVARLTRLNADSTDRGARGVECVEVYLRLAAGTPARRVGVLEIYLPYAPIGRDVNAGLRSLYIDLSAGLAVLYLALLAIAASVSRGLRRQVRANAFLAEHDALTGLPNRTLFRRQGAAALARARGGRTLAIAIIDLDRFKDVNDTLGHHSGDHLLTELARRMATNARSQDTLARLGGDEFGLILRDIAGEDAEQVLRRLRDVIDDEVEVNGLQLSIQASIGFVVAPADGTDVDTLLQRADVAMYLAKQQHRGVVRYNRADDHYDAANLNLVAELRHAVDAGELVLHYQPQVSLADGRPVAIEGLLRWQHPTRGLLSPDKFLPLAEQTDVIDDITHWVLRTAIADLQRLGRAGERLDIAVNVSARSVGRPDLAGHVIDVLRELDLPADRLIVEVTETALLTDPERAAAVLADLAAAGVKISLDDFGRGQTSLGYLSALPIHELKIDRGFIFDVLENRSHAAIVRSIIELGHNLGLRVVGEGVETEDVLGMLRDADCDVAQGFLLARPMPLSRLGGWLAETAQPHGGGLVGELVS